MEVGRYDFDNNLIIGSYYGHDKKYKKKEMNYDDYIDLTKRTCTKPTNDNPFMNLSSIDYGKDVPVACNSYDDEIKNDIKIKFNHNLFRDVDAVWEVENSQRQFYTMPNTNVPNKQIEFANWCYNNGPTCKEDQNMCYRYEDIRFNKF